MSPEMAGRLQTLRQKAIEGTATLEEYQEAVVLMRGDRLSSAKASETSRRAKAKAEIKSADEMLDEI